MASAPPGNGRLLIPCRANHIPSPSFSKCIRIKQGGGKEFLPQNQAQASCRSPGPAPVHASGGGARVTSLPGARSPRPSLRGVGSGQAAGGGSGRLRSREDARGVGGDGAPGAGGRGDRPAERAGRDRGVAQVGTGRGGSRARVRRHLRPGAGWLARGRRAVPGPPQATADSAGAGRRGRDRRGARDPGGAGCAWCPRCPRRPLLSPRVAPARPAPARGFPGGSGHRAAPRAVGGLRLQTGRTRDAAEPRSWPRAGGLPAATCWANSPSAPAPAPASRPSPRSSPLRLPVAVGLAAPPLPRRGSAVATDSLLLIYHLSATLFLGLL